MDLLAIAEQCRQPGTERRCYDARAVGTNESTDHDVKRVRFRLDRLDGGTDILRSPDFGWRDFDAERACGRDLGDALLSSLRPAILDRDGATLDPTEFTKSRHKSSRP